METSALNVMAVVSLSVTAIALLGAIAVETWLYRRHRHAIDFFDSGTMGWYLTWIGIALPAVALSIFWRAEAAAYAAPVLAVVMVWIAVTRLRAVRKYLRDK